MTETPTTMVSTERRQAIRLYAMHPDDREWLLSQLPDAPRLQLNRLLQELADLGFEPDSLADTVDGLLASSEPAPDDPRILLEQACPQWLFEQLAREPGPLVAALLHAQAWRWRPAVESLLASRPLAQHEPGMVLASVRVQEALIAILARRMPDDSSAWLTPAGKTRAGQVPRGRRPTWSSLRTRFVGWAPWLR